jgi:hypothetical protein
MKTLWMVAAELVPALVLIGVMLWHKRHRKKAGERPPLPEKLLRQAGHSLRVRLEAKNEAFAQWLGLGMVGGLLCGLAQTMVWPGSIFQWLIGGGIAATGVVMGSRNLMATRALRLGLMGENAVGEHLQSLVAAGYRVFHDVPGNGKWNIDHAVVGPAGLFAIETKARTKKPGGRAEKDHEVTFDGKELGWPWGSDVEALAQARRNAEWLGNEMTKATGERVGARPILAIPGWLVTLRAAPRDLAVLNGKQVPGFVKSEPRVLTEEQVQRIAYQLEQRCRDVEF